ncbi:hypothetical protein [Gordonia sp. (in: high G+C Gram-positive bacteria)]|uniref:hypothetical protein n=1 Tax=Gordonia sp. (in: high G+C Gram-positive bacteria) TaxID=84139 RepID=UPI003F9683B5
MADKSEPESKPITVSELIARSEGDDAFPRSESMSVRRTDRRDPSTAGPTASGMPSYRAPEKADGSRASRTIGASGMPGYSPPTTSDRGSDANAVTGIIPVVSDNPDVEPGSVRAADADDFLDQDLPATEYRSVQADSSSMIQVRRADESSPFEETATIPVVDDRADDRRGDDTVEDETDPDDETGARSEDVSDDDADSSGGAKTSKVAGAVGAVAAGGSILGGRAARKARKAERKAARRAEKDTPEPEEVGQNKTGQKDAEQPAGAVALGEQPTQTIEPVGPDVRDPDVRDPEARGAGTHDAAHTAPDRTVPERSATAGDTDEGTHAEDGTESEGTSPVLGWLVFVGELILGLAVGAGLFWGFTELWKRYVYLALILAIVVIFAIVTFAHILRKRDLPTTLLALGVGMVVTIGPLVLLAAQP